MVDLKSVGPMIPLYHAQLISYLNLSGQHKELLINLNYENVSKQIVSLATEKFASHS
jgi:hypothetical protein